MAMPHSPACSLPKVLQVAAAVTTAASGPCQMLTDTSDARPPSLSPRCSQPPAPFATLPDLQLSPFSMQKLSHNLPGRISAWLQRASSLLCVPCVTGSCFPFSCPRTPTRSLGTNILLLPPSQIFHFPGFLSNSQAPQICVPAEDFLFCFPVAVPTSIAAVMADTPAMEELCLYLCVCTCVCTDMCTGKGLRVCA